MNEISKTNEAYNYEIMEKVIAEGDLSKLNSQERVMYYNETCKSLELNPLTRPFEYIKLNGKLVLYARKDCTEQLRAIKRVSITKIENKTMDGVYVVTAYARSNNGHEDVATGAVTIKGLNGDALANAFMKAETKAKRRVTLSICGLGFTDESEVETIPKATRVNINHSTGEIIDSVSISQEPYTIEKCLYEIKHSKTMEELKKHFDKGKHVFKNLPEELEKVIKAKDKIKLAIEKKIEDDSNEYGEITDGA